MLFEVGREWRDRGFLYPLACTKDRLFAVLRERRNAGLLIVEKREYDLGTVLIITPEPVLQDLAQTPCVEALTARA